MSTTYTFDEPESGTDFVFGEVEAADASVQEDAEPLFKLDPEVVNGSDQAEASDSHAAPKEGPKEAQ